MTDNNIILIPFLEVCLSVEKSCKDTSRCYPKQYECDGHVFCDDGSDESGCGNFKHFHA